MELDRDSCHTIDGANAPSPTQRRSAIDGLKLFLERDQQISALIATSPSWSVLGQTSRNPISGTVAFSLKRGWMSGFSYVDFWTRDSVTGTVSELAEDTFLFRVVPLAYRTWMYHFICESGQVLESHDDWGMVRHVLDQVCIDAPVGGGRWSPLMCYFPGALFLALTGELGLAALAVGICVLLWALSVGMNVPNRYRLLRPVTLPLRLGVLITLVLTVTQSAAGFPLAAVGRVGAVMCALVDVVAGDGGFLWRYNLNCTYEIERVLPNRILVCRRQGASQYEEYFGDRGKVSPNITGLGCWGRNYALITEILGMVVELRPMQLRDWQQVWDSRPKQLPFYGLSMYSPQAPSATELFGKGLRPGRRRSPRRKDQDDTTFFPRLMLPDPPVPHLSLKVSPPPPRDTPPAL